MKEFKLTRRTTLKRKMLAGVVLSVIAAMLSLASNASAGQVTIINKTQDWNCHIIAHGYFLGVATVMNTPCALPGKTEWFHTSLSVGMVAGYCNYKGTSSNARGCSNNIDPDYIAHPKEMKDFRISGTWLPHRNFTITVTGNRPNIWKNGDLTFTLTEN